MSQANSQKSGAQGVVIRDFAAERRARREAQKRNRAFAMAGTWCGQYVRCGSCGESGHCTIYGRENPRRLIVTCRCGSRAEYTRESAR